jgi:hypothetical protein
MKQKKFVLPVCEDKKYDGIIYLQDNSKINYTCELGATNEFIGEVITTPKYPFVEFYKRYYSDTKSLAVIYSKIGEMSIDKYYHYDQNYKLVKEIDYKQKSHLPYTTILQSLEKLGYLDLKNVKLLIGNNEKFELSYSLKSSIDIDSTREKVPKNLQNRFDKSQGVWWYTINIKQAHPTIQRRLVFDDIDGSLLYQYEYRITDASEME